MGDAQGYFRNWKESMESFIYLAAKLAKPFMESLKPCSQPASVTVEDVERLRQRIHRIRAALADADRVEHKSESFKLWQRELRDVEYEAEDIMEEFELQAQRITTLLQLKSQLLRRPSLGKRKREVRFLLSHQPFQDLSHKIKLIRERYNDIAFDRDALWMREEDGEKLPSFQQERQSSSLISTNSCFIGRDEELKQLIERIVSDRDVEPIIAVVGMPGVGKTALAQNVFNSSQVKSLFGDRRWWIAVSSPGGGVTSMTRSIVDAITGGKAWEARSCDQLDVLQRVLTMELKERAPDGFLLVLDDARAEEQGLWETLCRPFSFLSGGKLLVTTQSSEIAQELLLSNCKAVFKPLHLHPLADKDCMSIVFKHQEANCVYPESMEKIIPRCGGLPRAANIMKKLIFERSLVGGDAAEPCEYPPLCSKRLWSDLVDEILPILRSSYDDLSLVSKRCFEYLSLFPRGQMLDKDNLARLWMAQELDQSDTRCFNELIRKWVLVYDSDAGKYRVRHLFHELARSVSDGECAMVKEILSPYISSVHRKPRHLSMVLQIDATGSVEKEIPQTCADRMRDELARLRTLLLIRRHEDCKLPFINARFSAKNLQFLPYLRTLDLSHTNIEELPIPIGNLSHLRYLGLRSTRIRGLPESLCLLYKLQTLDLRDCLELRELPWGTGCLSDLQHLELPPSPHLLMPCGIGGLTRLKTLSTFNVGDCDELCHIRELNELIELRGELYISGLNHVSCEKEAEKAKLKSKELVEKLTLKWSHGDSFSSEDGDETAMKVLEKLQPCTNLKSLVISGYHGTKLSSWLGDDSFNRLVSVTLEGCEYCTQLPPLGQLPVLKHLSVALMKRVQHVGREFCGSHGFPLLETLEFQDMPLWEVWCGVGVGDFASVKSISLTECPKLNHLPEFKPATRLSINNCQLPLHFFHCETV